MKIERQLAMMPDRQQAEIRVDLRVQHKVVVEYVFAQHLETGRQRK